ncbi:MAG: prolyl oligopeptidase family serine peptidase [Bacteroidota bacterium]|nr:prolyl oligopeptidase family serine peptidase [Bacteroidota bacterium]
MHKLSAFLFLFIPAIVFAQAKLDKLTVEKIMRDPKWIGSSPSNPFWTPDGILFFDWNPDNSPSDSLYFITKQNKTPVKATVIQKQNVIDEKSIHYNNTRTAYVYEKEGDIFLKEIKTNNTYRITQTEQTESNPEFSFAGKKIVYNLNQNLFSWDIATGETRQLTNFQAGNREEKSKEKPSPEEKWLKENQLQYLEILKQRKTKKRLAEIYDSSLPKIKLKEINIGDKRIQGISISPDGRFISYRLFEILKDRKMTIVPNYVTESGYTTDIIGRTKVGGSQAASQFFIYDKQSDSSFEIKTDSIKGIRDLPDYLKDYPKELKERTKKNETRKVIFTSSTWSPMGKNLVLDIRSQDHKDRWLMLWDTATKKLQLLDRQHDTAWIDGPGIWNSGWLDENNFWYQSETTGYSHLFAVNVFSGKKKVYTSGKFEVQEAKLSNDKKYFYITTNEVNPGEQQYYRLRIADSKMERITNTEGANVVTISPDEKTIAILYSYSNKPWELYLQQNLPDKKPEQITYKAQSEEFKSYPWKDPQIVTFTARDGATVYGRLYKPANPDIHKPAVVFVHGAGYLQNAHKWWSLYFREYMFHNMLADNGYYVIDIDYRGSAGYGRDWRTGIYRHMGGKDLADNVDAANYLIKNFGVDPGRIGIYGGSYGGFITLMAMFTTPDIFAAGAGLRSVTDWANYNHGYTSDILNEPFNDSLAYRRSSPIYYAEGLKGHLLMCHGMVDENVHFQDIVKVTQRLIELHKDNWELAVYPMEDHGFVEPSSWTDEYKRIFELFEIVLKK